MLDTCRNDNGEFIWANTYLTDSVPKLAIPTL